MLKKILIISLLSIFSIQNSFSSEKSSSAQKEEILQANGLIYIYPALSQNEKNIKILSSKQETNNRADEKLVKEANNPKIDVYKENKEMPQVNGWIYIYPTLIKDNKVTVIICDKIDTSANDTTVTNNWYQDGYSDKDKKIVIPKHICPTQLDMNDFKKDDNVTLKKNGDLIKYILTLPNGTKIQCNWKIDQTLYHSPLDPILKNSDILLVYLKRLTKYMTTKKKKRHGDINDEVKDFKKSLITDLKKLSGSGS